MKSEVEYVRKLMKVKPMHAELDTCLCVMSDILVDYNYTTTTLTFVHLSSLNFKIFEFSFSPANTDIKFCQTKPKKTPDETRQKLEN